MKTSYFHPISTDEINFHAVKTLKRGICVQCIGFVNGQALCNRDFGITWNLARLNGQKTFVCRVVGASTGVPYYEIHDIDQSDRAGVAS